MEKRAEGRDDMAFESDSPMHATLKPHEVPVPEAAPPTPRLERTEPSPADNLSDKPSPAPDTGSKSVNEPTTPITPGKPESAVKKKPWWYTDRSDVIAHRTRANSRRESEGSGMFTRALHSAYEGFHSCGNAFVVQTDAAARKDPRNHDEA